MQSNSPENYWSGSDFKNAGPLSIRKGAVVAWVCLNLARSAQR